MCFELCSNYIKMSLCCNSFDRLAHHTLLFMLFMEQTKKRLMRTLSKPLMEAAMIKCQDKTSRQWLRENSDSFFQLADMFQFLKEKIDEEEKKNHSDTVDIIFVAHGLITDPMIPACCLLPMSNISDVFLYSPWNCVTDANITYGIATGRMKPQHRVFYCSKNKSCRTPDKDHQPTKLPNQWNSLRKAGTQNIPTIIVSPLQPKAGVWKKYESLAKRFGPPGRNRIVIPFIFPEDKMFGSSETVPVYVVTLALSLVLCSSRFKATVHLDTCLSKSPADTNLDEDYLEQQYACTVDDTGMTLSDEALSETWSGFFQRLFS